MAVSHVVRRVARGRGSVGLVARPWLAAAAMLCVGLASASAQPAPEVITEDGMIAGTMNIDFATRTNLDNTGDLKKDSPAKGVKDRYIFSIAVAKTTEFAGEVLRQPTLYTKTLGRTAQSAELFYKIDLSVLNPKDLKQKRTVGRWVGTVPYDPATGAYDLAGGRASDSPLRINVDAVGRAAAFVDPYGGRLIGKSEKKESLATSTYKRIVGNRTVEVVVKKSDPMRFENLVLAKGPAETYPRTVVNGRLDYDYETGNYFADNIRFKYSLDGRDYEDVVTGTIKWIEDPERKTNGKGHYDFNLRFNEEKNKTATGEGAAFEQMSSEDAFFAVDTSVPSITGRITYVDQIPTGSELPTSSKAVFALNGNKLTKQQAMNFFKLWIVAIGPTNDE